MDITVGLFILGCAVVALAMGFFLLAFELITTKRNQRTSVSLQLYQQLQNPSLEAAVTQVRQLRHIPQNGDLPHLARDQWAALQETDRFFNHVGELVHRKVADDSIFALMGPTISEVWFASSDVRRVLHTKDAHQPTDYFDYLYEQWLNYDHWRQQGIHA